MAYDYYANVEGKPESGMEKSDLSGMQVKPKPKMMMTSQVALDQLSEALEVQKDLINSLTDVTRPYRFEEPTADMKDSGPVPDREPTSDFVHSILNRLDTVRECNARIRYLLETMR